MEGAEGAEGVPMDLKVSTEEVVVGEEGRPSSVSLTILVIELKRRSRRISYSICSCSRRRWLNFSAFALFHRENRTSLAGRGWLGFEFGLGSSRGAKRGNRVGSFRAMAAKIVSSHLSAKNMI